MEQNKSPKPFELTPDEKKLAFRLFVIGFLGLPLVWVVNVLTFKDIYYLAPAGTFKTCVKGSAILSVISITALVAWAVYFQLNYKDFERYLRKITGRFK
eukprot:maker-scaffold_5-snap-gene-20.10-mRNA-1 protein AED:0.05 eAED:0.05 QI:58/0.5/0.33/1/1/1/3/0/98